MKKQQQQQMPGSGERLRRRFDRTFKSEALKLLQSGLAAKEVSGLLGVSEQTLYNWQNQERRRNAGENSQDLKAARDEAESLRKRLREVETERDILKKALNIFSRST